MSLVRRSLLHGGLLVGLGGLGSFPALAATLDPARSTIAPGRAEVVEGSRGPPLRTPSGAQALRARSQFRTAIDYARSIDSDALLIWRGARLILAERFEDRDRRARAWSASMVKTVVALLVGVAIDEGAIRSVDQPAATLLPEWRGDARSRITIRDMLVMASGLDHPPSTSTADGVRAALALKAVDPPGALFDYNTQNVTLLMEMLSRATPNLLARADDWMRVGLLLLRRGLWNGRQLVDAGWIGHMLAPSSPNPGYGYLTWIGSPPGARRSYGPKVAFQAIHSAPFLAPDVAYLDGFGGQRVYVIPSRDLVIVRTGGTRPDFDDAIIPNAVVAAL